MEKEVVWCIILYCQKKKLGVRVERRLLNNFRSKSCRRIIWFHLVWCRNFIPGLFSDNASSSDYRFKWDNEVINNELERM
jgi:hypothetical protein